MALEQNRGRRRPHSELNRNTTEKNSENTISGEGRRKAPIVTLPEEKKEGKRYKTVMSVFGHTVL